jgi:hypothetical protein
MDRLISITTLCVALCLLIAGCTAPPQSGSSTEPATPPTTEPSCTLNHEIVEDSDRVPSIEQQYVYATLSSPAKNVFDRALNANESVFSVEDSSHSVPDEFAYTDVLTYYEIKHESQTYVLATWSGEGCPM